MRFTSALKLKRGEIEGIVQSERSVKEALVPIFDVACPSSKTSFDKRIEESLELIRRGWPRISREFFVDLRDLPLSARLAGGLHPVTALSRQLALHGHNAIHCFGFERDVAYEDALVNASIEGHARQIALRLDQHDMRLLDITEDLAKAFMLRLRRDFSDTTIIFDLGSIQASTDDIPSMIERAHAKFKALGSRRFIYLASAMWDYTRLPTEKVTKVPRLDVAIWEQIRRNRIEVEYGDYGVIAPSYVDPEKILISAPKFRYATPTFWLVSKGEKLRGGEQSSYPRIAQRLMESGDFRSNDFGWGHDQIRAFASYEKRTTDAAGAIAIDTCTHLDVTCRQVQVIERQIQLAQTTT